MPIEFVCPSCQQQLRVPDDAVGKNAKCPKCNGMAIVPAASAPASGPSPFAGAPTPFSPAPFAPKPAAPGPSPAPAWTPGAPSGGNPFSPSAAGANPYASPQSLPFQPSLPVVGADIRNQPVGVDPIFNYAWQIWQQHLGLLVGVAATMIGLQLAFNGAASGGEALSDSPQMGNLIRNLLGLVSNVIQLYLGIGSVQIALKLARGQRAEYAELFNGASRFWPVLGVSILLGFAIFFGLLLFIVPGIILALMWWPAYYLVVDNKCGVFDSFSLASKITEGNKGTAFLLWLLSIVIVFVGFLALCIGIIFAAPLITVMWAVAYLMMSGQLAPYAPVGQVPGAPQPWPAKP